MNFEKQIEQLEIAIAENERFIAKAKSAIKRLKSNDNCYSTKEMAAARRSAMDVKRQMTVINQLTMYYL